MDLTVNQAVKLAINQGFVENTPKAKYNLLVNTFNGSTVLLVTAVVFAILFAPSAAFTYGAISIFVRVVVERELTKYTAGLQETSSDYHKFFKEFVENKPNWVQTETRHRVFDYSVWKNVV